MRALWVAAALVLPAGGAIAGEKPKKGVAPQAVIAGTVFRETGFALRGATITVIPDPPPRKKTAWTASSDARGEFAIRVPAGPASYTVVVRAAGYRSMTKQATVGADERIELTFLLEAGTDPP